MNAYENLHASLMRRLAPDCTVLLKSDGSFPLAEPCSIALYGSGARHTIKGGTGYGEVNSRSFLSIEEGLEEAGFTVTTKYWLDTYDQLILAARRAFRETVKARAKEKHVPAVIEGMGAVMPEPEYRIPLYGEGDTAVYVLSRISGEGNDRQAVPGDILLTETEKRDILELKSKYARFLLVLNVGGVVDLSPVLEVGNILLLSQLGVETAHALVDLLLGKSCPSGKLTTTWAAWGDYCPVGEFGGRDDTRYTEGLYVGYRYFDTVGKKPLFPFGYGLSYTSFSVRPGKLLREGEQIVLKVSVANTGSRAGREVVQLYVSAPEDLLRKPMQSLAAYRKTRTLQPGEMEELSLRFSLRDLASYDESGSCWLLEKGEYLLRVGTSSADTAVAGVLKLKKEIITERDRPCGGACELEEWLPEKREEKKAPAGVPSLSLEGNELETRTVDYRLPVAWDKEIEALSEEELIALNVGRFDPKAGPLSIIGNASSAVPGAAGESVAYPEKGIPGIVMADGPAGLRLSREYVIDEKGNAHAVGQTMPESIAEFLPAPALAVMKLLAGGEPKGERHEQYATAIPIGTALAQSWDDELAESCGDMVGDEMERFGVQLWLAPALNLHRDIRCGRNFEYFSEDPLLSGKMAAAISRGVQAHPGCGVTIKHYAANNQETNRYNNNSIVRERTLRELYLRGFGIAVREGRPCAVMTSYNLLNGEHTSERRDLIRDVLRLEFGFDGIVMTDWIMGTLDRSSVHPAPNAGKIAAATGDLTMPGRRKDCKDILKMLYTFKLTKRELMANATRVVRMAKRLQKKD